MHPCFRTICLSAIWLKYYSISRQQDIVTKQCAASPIDFDTAVLDFSWSTQSHMSKIYATHNAINMVIDSAFFINLVCQTQSVGQANCRPVWQIDLQFVLLADWVWHIGSAHVRWPVDLCLSHHENLTNFNSENESLALSHYGHQNLISLEKIALSKNYRWIPFFWRLCSFFFKIVVDHVTFIAVPNCQLSKSPPPTKPCPAYPILTVFLEV